MGKGKIDPFNVWFTGLPLSGKTTIADLVHKKLEKLDIPLERLDSKDVRDLIRNMVKNNIVIYVKADLETCKNGTIKVHIIKL